MPVGLQAKLLRALQEGEIEPLGSNQLVPFDVRVIAATSRDLAMLVHEGLFREDLFYRLNVLPLRVPALRDRASDIPNLVEVLSEELALRSAVPQPEFQGQAVALLSALQIRAEVQSGLLAVLPVPLQGTERPIGLMQRQGGLASPVLQALLQALRDATASACCPAAACRAP
jgi:DNA-binding transcriptional LysR family regulator